MKFRNTYFPALLSAAVGLAAASPLFAADSAVLKEDSWTKMSSLPSALSAHRAVVAGKSIIVLGGRNRVGASQKSVYSVSIKGNGSLAEWKKAPDLPFAVSGHAAVECGGAVYIIGGYRMGDKADIMSDQVIYGDAGKDGIVRRWRETKSLPMRVHSHSAVSYGGNVYVAGGYTPESCISAVLIGRTGKSGGIVSWDQTLGLPTPLYNTAMTVVGRYLVVIGGQSPAEGKTLTVPTTYVGPVWKDGSITTWYLASSKLPANWLSYGRSKSSAVEFKGVLFAFGGQDAMWFPVKSAAVADFDREKGEMGEWTVMAKNEELPEITEGVVWKDFVYLVGGVKKGMATDEVYRGKFEVKKEAAQ